jgi:hypothetical protein
MADPDLSTTLPEKLPVAWPCTAGATMIARMQTTARRVVLKSFVPAKQFSDLCQLALTVVFFIVLSLQMKWPSPKCSSFASSI